MSQVCLVIGGTGALGRACAEDLASTGWRVLIAGRNESKGKEIVSAINAKGGDARFLTVDMKDHNSIKKLHQDAVGAYGRLDAAINAAGSLGANMKLADYPEESIQELVQVNVLGVVASMQEQIRAMQSNPGGSGGKIVNFSSILGLEGCKHTGIYSMTKHALVGLTKSAALDYSNPKDNILINAVAPGIILTEMTAVMDHPEDLGLPEGELKDQLMNLRNEYPQRRFGEVKDVARGVRYLLESPWVTGTVLEIDGGHGAGYA